ncbi:MAG TPA: MFS transporter [Chthoniobacter sp.]
MKTNSQLPSRAWLIVAFLWVVGGLNYLDRIMITTMHDSLVAAVPMTEAQFGLLTAMFLWVYAGISPFAGFLADRFPRSRIVTGSLLIWSSVTWLTGQAKTYDQLLATRALMGISEACFVPAALALITDYHRGPTRSLATGIYITGSMVGSALGGLGGWLAERQHRWNSPFQFFGLLGIGVAVLLAFALRDVSDTETGATPSLEKCAPPKARFDEALASLFGDSSFILTFVFYGLVAMTTWGVTGWMPTYLSEHFHLGQGRGGLSATGYFNGAMVVGLILGGAWADRWSRSNERARILVPVIGLFLSLPGLLLAANSSVLPVALAGLILFGLTRSFTDANIMPIVCLVANARYRATGFGVLNLFANAAGGLTIYAGGALRDAHVDVSDVFRVSAVMLAVCATLLLLVKPRATAT